MDQTQEQEEYNQQKTEGNESLKNKVEKLHREISWNG